MSEEDPALIGGELKEGPVVRPGQRGILGSDYVEIRDLPPEGAEDAAVEILVGQETQHGLSSKAGEEAVAQAGLRGAGLDLATDRLRPGPPLS